MKLDNVVPFGRTLDEYRHMFALSDSDLTLDILGVADGPASFNAEMNALGHSVVSIDPIYEFAGEDIARQFDAVVDDIMAQVQATPADWVWSYHRSPDALRQARVNALQRFVADFVHGRTTGRYRPGELPSLAVSNQAFPLALCSHFLFLYSEQLSYDFHLASVREMLRVAAEVRIFPLLTLALERSPYLERLVDDICADGFAASVERVDYELQRGGNEMLRIWQLS